LPSPGKAAALTDYQADLQRIQSDLAELDEKTAFAEPIQSETATRYVYRLYALCSLNGDLIGLRAVEQSIDRAIQHLGPAEDLCLLKANLDFKLHRLAETKRDLALAPALASRRPARVILADVAFQEGHYAEARQALEALASEDSTWDVLARLAHIEGKMGSAAKADDLYVKAQDEITAKEMRSFAWIELQRGLLALARGRVRETLEHYQCADRAYSGYWLTAEHIAGLRGSPYHYERVLAEVNKPEVAQKLGEIYAKNGYQAQAQPLLAQALEQYLESAQRGEVHYYHHLTEFFADVVPNPQEAVRWARKDIELRDNFNTQTALAWALHRAGQSSAALPYIKRAVESGVNDAALLNKAALIFEAAGDWEAALECEHRVVHLNPHHAATAHAHSH
jgi:tetratricopeptide (TPR) repeat protein